MRFEVSQISRGRQFCRHGMAVEKAQTPAFAGLTQVVERSIALRMDAVTEGPNCVESSGCSATSDPTP